MAFLVRIVNLDSYMSPPVPGLDVAYSEFRGSSVNQVPVLRLFGSTATGEKICVHIHGIFPYLYIPYDGSEEPNGLMYHIASSIDKAVNISLNQASSNVQHVYKVCLVSGIPMYGYHSRCHQFFKVYIYNPLLIRKVSSLLTNESTLGKLYQPHETHLNFTLQFMIDYNLHGMSNMSVSEIKFRASSIKKVTVCELEGDVLAEHILNRLEVASGEIVANPGIAALWVDERQRRTNKGETSQIQHLLELTRTTEPTKSHFLFKRVLEERLVALSTEKNVVDKLNASVYPVETPDNVRIPNASQAVSQTLSSLDRSSNDSSLNETLLQSFDVTMDEDALKLLDILNALGDAGDEDKALEDSILTQVSKKEDDESAEPDLSMPLDEATYRGDGYDDLDGTLIPQLDGQSGDLDEYFGPCDLLNCPRAEGIAAKAFLDVKKRQMRLLYLKKVLFVKIVEDMICDENGNIMKGSEHTTESRGSESSVRNGLIGMKEVKIPGRNIEKDLNGGEEASLTSHSDIDREMVGGIKDDTSIAKKPMPKLNKRKGEWSEARKNTEINRLKCRIAKLRRTNQIFAIMKKLHQRERTVVLKLNKSHEPVFKVVASNEVKAPYVLNQPRKEETFSKIKIISDIIIRTAKYVEPTLHLTVKTPGENYFLYDYDGSSIEPKSLKIPKGIGENEEKLKMFIKEHTKALKRMQKVQDVTNVDDFVVNENLEVTGIECYGDTDNKELMYIFSDSYLRKFDKHADFTNKSPTHIREALKDINCQLNRHIQCLQLPTYGINSYFNRSTEDGLLVQRRKLCPISRKTGKGTNVSEPVDKDTATSLDSSEGNHVLDSDLHSAIFRDDWTPPMSPDGVGIQWEENNIPYLPLKQVTVNAQVNSAPACAEEKVKIRKKRVRKDYSNQMPRKSERLKAKCLRMSLDGAADSSSSSEEDGRAVEPRRSQRVKSTFTRYSPLPISVVSSRKPSNKSAGCEPPSQCFGATFEEEGEEIDTKKLPTQPVCDISVKELLNFCDVTALNSTLVEERLVCAFSPAKIKEVTETCDSSDSSNMFSSDNEQDFAPKDLLVNKTAAEKYDMERNYRAKEGTSTALTPNEAPGSSEGSNFGIITPNQEKTAVIPEKPETSCDRSNRPIILKPLKGAPPRVEVVETLDKFRIPHSNHQVPFYGNVDDVTGSVEVGLNVLKINSKTTAHLPEFESVTDSLNAFRKTVLRSLSGESNWKKTTVNNVALSYCKDRECIITPVKKPPSLTRVKEWLIAKVESVEPTSAVPSKVKVHVPLSPGGNEDDCANLSLSLTPCTPSDPQSASRPSSPLLGGRRRGKRLSSQNASDKLSQITGVTIDGTFGFDHSAENFTDARVATEHQNLTVMVVELHVTTRGDFKPDPSYDSIRAIFYSVFNDVPESHAKGTGCRGVLAVNSLPLSPGTKQRPVLDGVGIDCDVTYVDSEEGLVNEFLKLVGYWDPDIFAGYEIELLSWGYLIERGSILGVNLKSLLSRVVDNKPTTKEDNSSNELKIVGRIVLDVWRLMRHEIALQSYTFESIVYHILHKRVPRYSFRDLTFWWNHRTNLHRHRVVSYYLSRTDGVLELFERLDFIGRTSELARLFGILFYEVLSRGSQFRVESMMLRLAKPLNFVPVSPSVQQRAHMRAPEYIALVMEPESKLYNDPVIVLDFQSLYPSIIIAYNYCFTTCVGRVEHLGKSGAFDFGATQLRVSRQRVRKLLQKDLLNFSRCGVAFVKKEVRDGIMPRMLREILDARLMVKNAMKENKDDRVLQKVLHNRQLGLKLIANVTYGYTAANFSGRMAAVEIADSVVSKGRETLQNAIELVDSTPEWGARVVYGDTDSLFVLVPGRAKEHAFDIGKKIADAVTKANPDPVKLKLEKVYQPCILQTKKRYVGYMYESADQKEPVYEAKGIETVRRDGCPAVSKMLEKCLRILFETKDVSLVKNYVLRQFDKILSGRASIQDLTFAKEYRGAAGYRPGACVPALELTRKWTAADKRNEPRSGERVPYVIVNGPPGLPLIRLVRSPMDLLEDPSLRANAVYYITKVIIPPINRCFNLIGADLNVWFNQMPRKQRQHLPSAVSPEKKSTISQYFSTVNCAVCAEQTQKGICERCQSQPQKTVIALTEKINLWERNYNGVLLICQSCTSSHEVKCVSLDCPVLYRRILASRDEQQSSYVRQLMRQEITF